MEVASVIRFFNCLWTYFLALFGAPQSNFATNRLTKNRLSADGCMSFFADTIRPNKFY